MKSYKDPAYDDLDAQTSAKLGLPDGLLSAIRLRGERSNADEVSEAGAKSVYQIIPKTREAAIKKWGIDAYLSPENAALVAGHLLKDSLERNQNDVAAAVQEYHGGTDRKGWGSRTSAYLNRVMTGLAPEVRAPRRRLSEELNTEAPGAQPSLANVFKAYAAGTMDPESAAELEADVAAGRVIPPRGVKVAAPKGAADPLQGVLDAYYSGRMQPDEKAEFEADVAAGRVTLPPGVQLQAGNGLAGSARASQIPGQDGRPVNVTTAPEPTLAEKAVGTAEAALSTVTGATTGAAGMVAGTVGGLAGAVLNGEFGTPEGVKNVERAAMEGAQALTYAPRTQSGQDQAAAVGHLLQQALPIAPLGAEMAAAGRGAATAGRAANDARAAMAAQVRAKVEAAAARRAQAAEAAAQADGPTPGTMGSVGAAGTDMATLRRTAAAELPVPIELTKGQATRRFEQTRFEQEMAKDPTKGAPLRERFMGQNDALLKNFDIWVDETGATLADLPSVGDAVTAALRSSMAADKTKTRAAYKAAEKAGDMEAPVTLERAVSYLNENAPDAVVAPLLDAAKARALRTGVAILDESTGELIAQPVALKTAELFRRAISNATDIQPTNIRHASQLKSLVDEATQGVGGQLYQEARALRTQFAQNYENLGLVRDLIGMKRGTTDARVAAEDVFRRAILNAPMADVKQLRRVLQTGGEGGQQAWRELQGATVRHIRDEATKNVARNEKGDPLISPAGLDKTVTALDKSGKLDFIFGRRGAEQMRAVNDLAKVIYTAPPGAINTSNTASVLLASLDMATSGLAGMPLPVMSGLRILTTHVKDRQIQKRINEALGIQPQKKVKAPRSIVPPKSDAARAPETRTVH
jgi:hypothetical protein